MENCQHKNTASVYIGYSPEKDSLFYKISVCIECGKYIDTLDNLKTFEQRVSKKLGRDWKWKDTYMPEKERKYWKPSETTRFIVNF